MGRKPISEATASVLEAERRLYGMVVRSRFFDPKMPGRLNKACHLDSLLTILTSHGSLTHLFLDLQLERHSGETGSDKQQNRTLSGNH